ncbi:MAG: hypothetical protein ACLFVY_08975, partial [Phycisphaerae bacterium]
MARTLSQSDSELFIEYALRMTKGRIRLVSAATAMLTVVAAAAAFLLVMVAADHFVAGGLSPTVATVLRVLFVLTELGLLAALVVVPLVRKINNLYVARLIERSHPEFRNDLVSALQLEGDARVGAGSLQAIKRRAAGEVAEVEVESSVNTRGIRLMGIVCLVAIVLFGGYCLLSDKAVWPSVARVALGNDQIAAPTITRIVHVTPAGGSEVLSGSAVTFRASIEQRKDSDVVLKVYRDGANRLLDDDVLVMKPTGREVRGGEEFVATWPSASAMNGKAVRFEIVAGDARRGGMLKVLQEPTLSQLRATLHWPEYTGKGAELLESGSIEALAGTRVSLVAVANHEVQSAKLRFENGGARLMSVDGHRMQTEFRVTDDDRYRVVYRGAHALVEYDRDSWFAIRVLTDRPPVVKLTEPGGQVELPVNETLRITGEASDEYGLAKLTLVVREMGAGRIDRIDLGEFAAPGASTRHIGYTTPVEQLGREGQRLRCYLEARDHKGDDGQLTRSEAFELLIQPPDEQLIAQQQAQQEAMENQPDGGRRPDDELTGERDEQARAEEGAEEGAE